MSLNDDIREQFIYNTLFEKISLNKVLNEKINLKNKFLFSKTDDLLYDISKIDMLNYLPNDILFKVDRCSSTFIKQELLF